MAGVYQYTFTRKRIGDNPITVTSPSEAVPLFREKMQETPNQESIWVMALDPQGALIGIERIAIGNETSVMWNMKQIFRLAIRVNAFAIAVAHYHTVDDVTPSTADYRSSEQTLEAGAILQIPVHGCLVISDTDWKMIDPDDVNRPAESPLMDILAGLVGRKEKDDA